MKQGYLSHEIIDKGNVRLQNLVRKTDVFQQPLHTCLILSVVQFDIFS